MFAQEEEPAPAPAEPAPVETPVEPEQPRQEPAPREQPAPTPEPTPAPAPERPRPQEVLPRENIPPARPAAEPERPGSPAEGGMINELPDLESGILPGFEPILADPPHREDQDQVGVTTEPEETEPAEPEGPSIVDLWFDWIRQLTDNTYAVNAFLVVALIVIFVIYRLRAGPRRMV